VLTTHGYALLYGLTIASQLAAVAVLLSVPEPPAGEPAPLKPSAWRDLRRALRLLRSEPELRQVALLSVFTPPLAVVLAYGWQPYLQSAHVPAALFGVALSLASAASVAANLVAHRLEARMGARRAMTLAILAPALLWAAMAATTNPALALVDVDLALGFAACAVSILAGWGLCLLAERCLGARRKAAGAHRPAAARELPSRRTRVAG
jgi:predicted MFS family arabinose efflux permease